MLVLFNIPLLCSVVAYQCLDFCMLCWCSLCFVVALQHSFDVLYWCLSAPLLCLVSAHRRSLAMFYWCSSTFPCWVCWCLSSPLCCIMCLSLLPWCTLLVFINTPLLHYVGAHHSPLVVLCWCSSTHLCCVLLVLVGTCLLCFIGMVGTPLIMLCWFSSTPPCYCWCLGTYLTFNVHQHSIDMFYCCSSMPPCWCSLGFQIGTSSLHFFLQMCKSKNYNLITHIFQHFQ